MWISIAYLSIFYNISISFCALDILGVVDSGSGVDPIDLSSLDSSNEGTWVEY